MGELNTSIEPGSCLEAYFKPLHWFGLKWTSLIVVIGHISPQISRLLVWPRNEICLWVTGLDSNLSELKLIYLNLEFVTSNPGSAILPEYGWRYSGSLSEPGFLSAS